jgi:hypothetical protein
MYLFITYRVKYVRLILLTLRMFVKTIFFHGSMDLVDRPVHPHCWVSANSFNTHRHSVGPWTRDQPKERLLTTHTHTRQTSMSPGEIRTCIPSERAAPDPRLGKRGHCDRLQLNQNLSQQGEDLTEASVKNDVWDVTPCSLVDIY